MSDRPRIILALSDRAEATTVADWLTEDGFEPVRRPTPQSAVEEMRAHPFDLLIADAVPNGRPALRSEGRARRPLTPAILIGNTSPARGETVTTMPIYLKRPLDRAHLRCYISMAILEGSPIRCSERKLVEPFEAVVNGMPSHIIDISTEGVRLRMPRDAKASLPPYFTVRVPLMGVGVNVRRVWARSAPTGTSTTLYFGGSLLPNRPSNVQGWKSLIETMPKVVGKPRT